MPSDVNREDVKRAAKGYRHADEGEALNDQLGISAYLDTYAAWPMLTGHLSQIAGIKKPAEAGLN